MENTLHASIHSKPASAPFNKHLIGHEFEEDKKFPPS
jgi:hypothetical protein